MRDDLHQPQTTSPLPSGQRLAELMTLGTQLALMDAISKLTLKTCRVLNTQASRTAQPFAPSSTH